MTKVAEAVKILTKEIMENKEFYDSYHACITMAMYDALANACYSLPNMKEICNVGATNFMHLWLRD